MAPIPGNVLGLDFLVVQEQQVGYRMQGWKATLGQKVFAPSTRCVSLPMRCDLRSQHFPGSTQGAFHAFSRLQ